MLEKKTLVSMIKYYISYLLKVECMYLHTEKKCKGYQILVPVSIGFREDADFISQRKEEIIVHASERVQISSASVK